MIIVTVPLVCLDTHHDINIRFGSVSIITLLTHLWTRYGYIVDDMVSKYVEIIKSL